MSLPPTTSIPQQPSQDIDRGATTYFVFTDLSKSTNLWEEYPVAMARYVGQHLEGGQAIFLQRGGNVFEVPGDGLHVAFGDLGSAVGAVLDYLEFVGEQPWEGLPAQPRGRAAITAGLPFEDEQAGFVGSPLNLAARLVEAAQPGQAIASQPVAAQIETPANGDGAVSWRFLGHYRLRGFPRPESIYQLCASGIESDFPALRAVEQRVADIPNRDDSFIGRAEDVAAVQALLRDPKHRVITLIGPGGVGKTRLSEVVATTVTADYAFQVFRVPLAPLSDIGQLPQAIVAALGIDGAGIGSIESLHEPLAQLFRSDPWLMLFDNCEHLVDSGIGKAIRSLIETLPGLQVLATSRHALRLSAERRYQVSPLGTRWDMRSPTPAMTLLLDRARAINRSFAPRAGDMEPVAQLCDRLGGLPLAIEVVASWADLLTASAMIERIAAIAEIPGRGDGDTPDRHASLRAAIEYSLQLLSAQERSILESLCVFPGVFALDAAEEVWEIAERVRSERLGKADGSSSVLEPRLVLLDGVGKLILKSLVALVSDKGDDDGVGRRWLQILQPIREYVERHDEDKARRGEIEAAHAAYFSRAAKRNRELFLSPRDAEAVGWFHDARIDLEAAFGRMRAGGNRQAMTNIAIECYGPFYHLGWQTPAAEWLQTALLEAHRAGDQPSELTVVVCLCGSLLHSGDYDRILDLLDRGLQLCKTVGSDIDRSRIYSLFNIVMHCKGDFESAREYAQKAVETGRTCLPDKSVISLLLNGTIAESRVGNKERAWELLEEARTRTTATNSPYHRHLAHYVRAQLYHDDGDLESSRSEACRAAVGLNSIHAPGDLVWALHLIAETAVAQGDIRVAAGAMVVAKTSMRAWSDDLKRDFREVEQASAKLVGDSAWKEHVQAAERLPSEELFSEVTHVKS